MLPTHFLWRKAYWVVPLAQVPNTSIPLCLVLSVRSAMFKLCLFDLDQTLVKTIDMEKLRESGKHNKDAAYKMQGWKRHLKSAKVVLFIQRSCCARFVPSFLRLS